MRNLKVLMAYRGTAYHGFQIQNNAYTVQEVVQKCVSKVLNEPVTINGCSRTDAGVHAKAYCFSVRTNSRIPTIGFIRGVNGELPKDISILSCEEVDEDFHARFSCSSKEYLYLIHNSECKDPFTTDLAYHYRRPFHPELVRDKDIEALMEVRANLDNVVEARKKISGGGYDELEVPGVFALVAAVISIAVKEWMFRYTRAVAKQVNSGALMADAWHHRSDALSSVGSFVGILFAILGYPVMDSVASVIISVCIIKAAYDVFKDAFDKMVDHSCDDETESEIRSIVMEIDGVKGIDVFKTRIFGAKIYVDMEISADGDMTLRDAHEIAEKVHDAVEEKCTGCKHCMVHVNPYVDDEK